MIILYSPTHPHPDEMTREQRREMDDVVFDQATFMEWQNSHSLYAIVRSSQEDTLAYRILVENPIRIKAIPR